MVTPIQNSSKRKKYIVKQIGCAVNSLEDLRSWSVSVKLYEVNG